MQRTLNARDTLHDFVCLFCGITLQMYKINCHHSAKHLFQVNRYIVHKLYFYFFWAGNKIEKNGTWKQAEEEWNLREPVMFIKSTSRHQRASHLKKHNKKTTTYWSVANMLGMRLVTSRERDSVSKVKLPFFFSWGWMLFQRSKAPNA